MYGMIRADQRVKNNMADSCRSKDFSRQVTSDVEDEGTERLQIYCKPGTMHAGIRGIDGLNLSAGSPRQYNRA